MTASWNWRALIWAFLTATALQCSPCAILGQVLPLGSSSAAVSDDASDRNLNSALPPDHSESADSRSQIVLSAAQILSLLQDKPEILPELKDLLAQTLPENGTVQGDSISDEQLYAQIASSIEFRQQVTGLLRARGYISNDEFQHPVMQTGAFINGSVASSGVLDEQLGSSQQSDGAAETLPSLRQPLRNQSRRNPVSGETGAEQPPSDTRNITSEPQVLRRPAPYNLPSLRDLYTQIPESGERLKRFGSEVFTRRDRSVAGSVPLDVPAGPDYILGPGDGLTIELWGGVSQSLRRVVAQDGHLNLPEAGDVQVAGLTLAKTQQLVQEALRKQFRDVQTSIALSRLRTIRIYVVGDVQRPGAYEISSLASPLTALFAAGGPTAVGSLRILKHYRNTQLIGTVDLYDFLLHGVQSSDERLEAGDTLAVPPVGPQVAVWGAIKRPAIYELKGPATLDSVLQDAGGVTVAASLRHISIERIDANQQRITISIGTRENDPKPFSGFAVKDGDRIRVAPIAPYSERVIYVEGHVVRPGRHPFRDGLRLSDILRSYQDLLPEPASIGEIARLVPPDLHVETLEFSLPDVLLGNGNLPLQPFDTIRVFGRYEVDAPHVEVRGEVLRPGSYPLSEGMTASQLVRMAGGFKRGALVDSADLTSYRVVDGTKIETERSDIRIGDAVDHDDSTADRVLKPGDVLTIHQITGWSDIGASITIEGEVAHPGSYGFQDGEHLSDVLRRAGGFRETAYPAGAVLIRDQVRDLEEKSRSELVRQIETSAAAARLSSNITSADQSGQALLIQQQQEQILSQLKNQPATGRLVIHITNNLDSWAGTAADIEVRRGDVLRIPKRPGFVLVSGQVYNASAITFAPGKTAGWYLQRAGGATSVANRKEIFVIRANGSVIGRRSGEWYEHNVLSTKLQPGDVIVVPQKIIGGSLFWRNLLSTAQIASSIAITAAVAGL